MQNESVAHVHSDSGGVCYNNIVTCTRVQIYFAACIGLTSTKILRTFDYYISKILSRHIIITSFGGCDIGPKHNTYIYKKYTHIRI